MSWGMALLLLAVGLAGFMLVGIGLIVVIVTIVDIAVEALLAHRRKRRQEL